MINKRNLLKSAIVLPIVAAPLASPVDHVFGVPGFWVFVESLLRAQITAVPWPQATAVPATWRILVA